MIVNISVTQYWQNITIHEVGLARDAHTASVLRTRYSPNWFSSPRQWVWNADFSSGPGFQWYVDKYAEVVTMDPWSDIAEYFYRLSRVTGSSALTGPLYYPADTLS